MPNSTPKPLSDQKSDGSSIPGHAEGEYESQPKATTPAEPSVLCPQQQDLEPDWWGPVNPHTVD